LEKTPTQRQGATVVNPWKVESMPRRRYMFWALGKWHTLWDGMHGTNVLSGQQLNFHICVVTPFICTVALNSN
jgi:hypothetical protein